MDETPVLSPGEGRRFVPEPARLLYVIVNMDIGGAERQFTELIARLPRERYSVHVCCLNGPGQLLGRLAGIGIPNTVYAFGPLDSRMKLRAGALFLKEIRTLRRLMLALRPQIVHTVLPLPCVVGGIAAGLSRVPVLVTSRRSLGCYKEGRLLLRELENLVNLRADAVVANSEAVRANTLALERIDKRRMSVIYNGVAIPAQGKKAEWRDIAGGEATGPVVCCVANFFPYKGHLDLIAAARRVVDELPGTKFVLVGDGKIRSLIEEAIEKNRLRADVLLLGRREDGAEIMRIADLVVLASHQEGFPNVLLEAMAAGKPVVATRVGGAPEIVRDGVTGLLAPPRAPGQLADAIIRVLKNRAGSMEMGRRGLELVKEKFSMEKMVESYMRLYDSLLQTKNEKPGTCPSNGLCRAACE